MFEADSSIFLRDFSNGLTFLNLAGTQTTGTNQKAFGASLYDGTDDLKVGHLAAKMHAGNVQSDTALFFRLTTAGNFAGLNRAFGTNVTNLSHCDLLFF